MDEEKRNRDIEKAIDAALAHHQAGQLPQAESIYRKILDRKPDHPDALHLLGMLAHQTGHNDAAVGLISKAIGVNATSPFYYNNLGSVYLATQKLDEATACFRKALSLRADFAEAHNNLGMVYIAQGRHDKALQSFGTAVELRPDYGEARWGVTMTQILPVHGPDDSPSKHRSAFARELAALERWSKSYGAVNSDRLVGSHQPFYLAYQEENNRDLLSAYGAICACMMQGWQNTQGIERPEPAPAPGKSVRVGIVSAHIHEHSVWNAIVKGWLRHMRRDRFEFHIFHLGTRQDAETDWARSNCQFLATGTKNLRQWIDLITRQSPDVLIFPEIGMDPTTVRLASLRLAPVQAATWGHPETSGLPTMDYYLSAEDLEPPDAQENYTETLVRLPHLGCCYQPLPVADTTPDFEELGINPGFPVLVCPGTPFKYAPQHDAVFIEIARRLETCQFVFFRHHVPEFTNRLKERLRSSFAEAGLNADDHCIFIPWQERAVFHGLLKQADVFLDTIGFSGFNTAMQALECGLPVVTREGRFMRGRLASGILRRTGITELIAGNEKDYVALAVRCVRDADYNQRIRQRITAARHLPSDDLAPVEALEIFLGRVSGKY